MKTTGAVRWLLAAALLSAALLLYFYLPDSARSVQHIGETDLPTPISNAPAAATIPEKTPPLTSTRTLTISPAPTNNHSRLSTATQTSEASRQERAFQEFLEKANHYSELTLEEFHLLEQISALHPERKENTNYLVFEKMRLAFEELGRQAGTNDNALQLLQDAARLPNLRGVAVAGMGVAADNGSGKAVDLLLEPEKNGWLLSSSAGALVNSARAGNDRAISFMYRLAFDEEKKALWGFATDALGPAAEAGNEQAIAGLVNMSALAKESIRQKISGFLETAAARGNSSAASAVNAIRNSNGNP